MGPKPHFSYLKGRALGYIWINRKNWVGFNDSLCWDDKNGCRARGQGSRSSAQQWLALLHPAVLCGPYNLQLKPFPRDQSSHTGWCWITLSLVMLQDGSYPSHQVKPCTQGFLHCCAVQLLPPGREQPTPGTPWVPPELQQMSPGEEEGNKKVFFKGEKILEGKKLIKRHAATLQCSVFCNWKEKNKQNNPGGMDRTTTQLFQANFHQRN